jgi:TonB family protein
MLDRRHRTDPRSPVQPDRPSLIPFVVLAVLALAILWTVRDSWLQDQSSPYQTEPADQQTPLASGDNGATPAAAIPTRGDLTGLFSAADYPTDALRREEQGTVTAELAVDKAGRVTHCAVAKSSGSDSLDRTTCAILSKRARFSPATDQGGQAISSSFTQRVTWRLQ